MYELGEPFGERAVEPGTNLLVTGPPLSGKQRLGYAALGHGLADGQGAIVVTNREGVATVRERYGDALAGDAVGVIDCVTEHRGGTVTGGFTDIAALRSVGTPDDMTGIGMAFSDLVETVSSDRDDWDDWDNRHSRVLFDSVSTLLLYSNLQTVFRFLHVLTARVAGMDGLGLFLLESTAHEERVRDTLGQLFDGVVHTDEDGTVEVRL